MRNIEFLYQEDLNSLAENYCGDKLAFGKPCKKVDLGYSNIIVTGVHWQHNNAKKVLANKIVPKEEYKKVKSEDTYEGKEIKIKGKPFIMTGSRIEVKPIEANFYDTVPEGNFSEQIFLHKKFEEAKQDGQSEIHKFATETDWKFSYAWRLNNLWVVCTCMRGWNKPTVVLDSDYTLGVLYYSTYYLTTYESLIALKGKVAIFEQGKFSNFYQPFNLAAIL